MDKADKNQDPSEGATTFIDTVSLIQALHGKTINQWKQIHLEYETELAEQDTNGKEVYFDGKANKYTFPLILECPDKNDVDVLRWWQNWSKEEFPNAKQNNHYNISKLPESLKNMTSDELEADIRKVAFDQRFFFYHQCCGCFHRWLL